MTPLPFEPYPKVSESPSEWRLTDAERRIIDRTEWVVTEKIHGANFAFLSDGRRPACAKRKAVLGADESFFAHERLIERHGDAVRALARRLGGERVVTVHGELFGGGYPHPDVAAVEGVQPVQTGVWYAPDVEFVAFDIAVTGDDGVKVFLDFDDAAERAAEVGVPFVAVRFRGSLSDALGEPCSFRTAVPDRYGLPPIEDNLAEGVVIKPVTPLMVETRKGLARPMVKRKIAAFVEDARYHQAQKWAAPPRRSSGVPALDLLEFRAGELLESNRYAAARSKQGPIAPSDRAGRAVLRAMLVEDVFDTLDEAHGDALRALDDDERSFLRALVEDAAEALIERELGRVS